MPNVTLHFYAANDLNGDVLHTITDEDSYLKAVELRVALSELGGGSFRLSGQTGLSLYATGMTQPEVFCRVLVHAYSSTEYFWGFFLNKRAQKIVGEEGTEEFIFGGPGPKQYLDRAVLGIEQYTSSGWNIDLEAGVFRFEEAATAGRILNRLIAEDAANPVPGLPDLTTSFGSSNDSDGNPWTNTLSAATTGDEDFELPIGASVLKNMWTLEDAAPLESRIYLGTVATPRFRLDAWPEMGDDKSGAAYGADVLRFQEANNADPNGNIGSLGGGHSLTAEGESQKKVTHVIVRGKDGAWAIGQRPGWVAGDYVKWGMIDYSITSRVDTLEDAGLRWIRRQEDQEHEYTVPILPGFAPEDGRYFPEPDGLLWVGNTASIRTGNPTTSVLDLDDDFRVTGILMELAEAAIDDEGDEKRALSWEVRVQLNTTRGGASAPSQGTTGPSSGGCKCPVPCRPLVPGEHTDEFLGAACSNSGVDINYDWPSGTDYAEMVEITLPTPVPVGNTLIAVCGFGQINVSTTLVVDEQGNTWTRDTEYENTGSSLDDTIEIWRCIVTNPLAAGDYVRYQGQVPNSAVSDFRGRCIGVYRYTGELTAPSVGTGEGTVDDDANIATPAGDVVVAAVSIGSGTGSQTITPDVDWDDMIPTAQVLGTSTDGRTIFAQQLQGAAASSWQVAWTAGIDYAAIAVGYSRSGAVGAPRGGNADLVGTDSCYARGDHKHLVFRDAAPTVDDDWEIGGYRPGTIWLHLDDLGTPTEVEAAYVLVDDATGAAVWLPWPDETGGGGSYDPSSNKAAGSVNANSSTFTAKTGGPVVTVTIGASGEAMVYWGCRVIINSATTSRLARMRVMMSGANTGEVSARYAGIRNSPAQFTQEPHAFTHLTGLTPGSTTFTAEYNCSTDNADFTEREVVVIPV